MNRKHRSAFDKMLFDIFNTTWSSSWESWGGNPFGFEGYLMKNFDQYENLEEEIFEVTKGNYKTVIRAKFNKEGFMVMHECSSEHVLIEKEVDLNQLQLELEGLQLKLKEAVDAQEYERAAEINKKIKAKYPGTWNPLNTETKRETND